MLVSPSPLTPLRAASTASSQLAVLDSGRPAPPDRNGFGDALEWRIIERFGSGKENFVVPSKAEMEAFRALVARARGGVPLDRLRSEAKSLGYSVDRLQAEGRNCLMLHEDQKGWGTVIVDPTSKSDVVVEIPHPGFDYGTPELGWLAFNSFGAGALVVAGATRGNRAEKSPDIPQDRKVEPGVYDPWKPADGVPEYSISDPTHARQTMFQAAHQALSGPGSRVLQLHGFSAQKHHKANPEFPGDEQMVLTDCAHDQYDPPVLLATQDALTRAGFRSHIVTFQDDATSRLGGLANMQHLDMVERGVKSEGPPKDGGAPQAEMVHVEVDTTIRRGADRNTQYQRIIDALRPVYRDALK